MSFCFVNSCNIFWKRGYVQKKIRQSRYFSVHRAGRVPWQCKFQPQIMLRQQIWIHKGTKSGSGDKAAAAKKRNQSTFFATAVHSRSEIPKIQWVIRQVCVYQMLKPRRQWIINQSQTNCFPNLFQEIWTSEKSKVHWRLFSTLF